MKHDPENPKLPAPVVPAGADGLRMGAASNVTIVGEARDAPVAGRRVECGFLFGPVKGVGFVPPWSVGTLGPFAQSSP